MSGIQDEAYSEAMDEIQRLEQLNDALIADKNGITEIAKKSIAKRDAEIDRLKGQIDVRDAVISKMATTLAEWRPLITRAADVLEEEFGPPTSHDNPASQRNLIVQLREAIKS